jgi:hypothetical protein
MNPNLTQEQERRLQRVRQLITGRGICAFAATGQRLSLKVKSDEERIPESLMKEEI